MSNIIKTIFLSAALLVSANTFANTKNEITQELYAMYTELKTLAHNCDAKMIIYGGEKHEVCVRFTRLDAHITQYRNSLGSNNPTNQEMGRYLTEFQVAMLNAAFRFTNETRSRLRLRNM